MQHISYHYFFFTFFRAYSTGEEQERKIVTQNKKTSLKYIGDDTINIALKKKTKNQIMGTRTAANSLVKRTAFSSAINIFPNEVAGTEAIHNNESTQKSSSHIRPYSEIPGPKELPLIGNSWRFAPIIGET